MKPEEIEKAAIDYASININHNLVNPMYSEEGFKAGARFIQQNGIRWRKIDPENLPKGTVIAIKKNGMHTIGVLMKMNSRGKVACNNSSGDTQGCTHFILLSDLSKLPVEE